MELLAGQGCWRRLLQVASGLSLEAEQGRSAVSCAAAAFRGAGQLETTRELLSRLGDSKARMRQRPLCISVQPCSLAMPTQGRSVQPQEDPMSAHSVEGACLCRGWQSWRWRRAGGQRP